MHNLNRSLGHTLAVASASLVACSASEAPSAPRGPGFAIAIAPITLSALSDACYTLAVYSESNLSATGWNPSAHASALLWQRAAVCASDYGIGTGGNADLSTTAIAYTGICDISANAQSIVLTLDGLYRGGAAPESRAGGDGLALTPNDYMNPCPVDEPCIVEAQCQPNNDTPVTFDLTVMRNGGRGFFDVSVAFDDMFCSAKFDCAYRDGTPIAQVIGADGKLAPTAVLGFACAAGDTRPTHLYMTDLHLTCSDGSIDQVIHPKLSGGLFEAPLAVSALPANHAIFQAITSLGAITPEANVDQFYWNASLGFAPERLVGKTCIIRAKAAGADGLFTDPSFGTGLTPPDATYPYVAFDVPMSATLTSGSATLTCGGGGSNMNPLNGTSSGVRTYYTGFSDRYCFDLEYPNGPTGAVDDEAADTTCLDDIILHRQQVCAGNAPTVAGQDIQVEQLSGGALTVRIGNATTNVQLPPGTVLDHVAGCCVAPCCQVGTP